MAASGPVALSPVAHADTGMPPGVREAIIQCESGGSPHAQNKSSTASGLYQFIDGTWKAHGGSTAHARDASIEEQHRVADHAYAANGLADWEASKDCWSGKVAKHASGKEAPRHAVSSRPRHDRAAVHPDRVRTVHRSGDTYVVVRGDSLSAIAAQHGTTWQRIYASNRGTVHDPDRIFPGQRLHVAG
jgi:LysM repeat protein